MYSGGFALPAQHVHLVCVLTDAQRSFKQPEILSFIQMQPQGDVSGPLCEVVAA